MKKDFKHLLNICNLILTLLIIYNIFSYRFINWETSVSALSTIEEKYVSYLEIDNEESNIDTTWQPEIDVEIKKPEEPTKEENQDINEVALETLVGNLVGYGPDCFGCTTKRTASGQYIGEGNIYYYDESYGKIRIVAGDNAYPFGTIVKISNVDFYNDEPFYAIVLDRGSDIGKGKKFLFDLLFSSESEAYKLGKEVNIKYEIMRLGY